jgi:hypothetical protein
MPSLLNLTSQSTTQHFLSNLFSLSKPFKHFCEINHVIEMTEAQQAWNDAQEDKWRYGVEPTVLSQAREHSRSRRSS